MVSGFIILFHRREKWVTDWWLWLKTYDTGLNLASLTPWSALVAAVTMPFHFLLSHLTLTLDICPWDNDSLSVSDEEAKPFQGWKTLPNVTKCSSSRSWIQNQIYSVLLSSFIASHNLPLLKISKRLHQYLPGSRICCLDKWVEWGPNEELSDLVILHGVLVLAIHSLPSSALPREADHSGAACPIHLSSGFLLGSSHGVFNPMLTPVLPCLPAVSTGLVLWLLCYGSGSLWNTIT